MDVRRHLQAAFDYDRWATARWEGALAEAPFADRAREVLGHIGQAQAVWVERIREALGTEEDAGTEPAEWLARTLGHVPLDQPFTWIRRRTGEPHTNVVEDVYVHLPLHGTYHRGQLRGLAEASGWTGFPETDAALCPLEDVSEPGHGGLDLLDRRFAHDVWAWGLWAEALVGSPIEARGREVAVHHAGCPVGWGDSVARAFGVPGPAADPLDPTGTLRRAAGWWRRALRDLGPHRRLTLTRPSGEDATWTLERIALHATNHGAYHRGQLRGLAEAAGWEDFPDTDYVVFRRM